MGSEEYSNVRIRREYLARLRKLADKDRRSMVKQIESMIETEERRQAALVRG